MREQIINFLEENFGDLERFPDQNLKVDAYPFCNEEIELKNVKVVGNNECFELDEYYHYVLSGDKLYKAYFACENENGEMMELDRVDYNHAYRIEDVTDMIDDIF